MSAWLNHNGESQYLERSLLPCLLDSLLRLFLGLLLRTDAPLLLGRGLALEEDGVLTLLKQGALLAPQIGACAAGRPAVRGASDTLVDESRAEISAPPSRPRGTQRVAPNALPGEPPPNLHCTCLTQML